jgi:hypothetical protein
VQPISRITMVGTMIKNPADYTNPFSAKLVEQLRRAQAERREREAIYRETKDVVERAFKAPDAAAFAAAVARASAKARGEVAADVPRFSDDAAGRKAKLICNAARKARGQEPFK